MIPGRSTVHQQRRYLPQTLTLQSHVIHTQAGGPPHLYMSAVVAPGRKLDASEGDRTLERHLDGRLFHTILAVNAGCSWDGAATEVPLNYGRTEQDELYCVYLMRNTVILRNVIYLNTFKNGIYCCDAKQNFRNHYFSLQCHMIFRNNSDMLIFSLLSMLKVVLLNFFLLQKPQYFFSGFFDGHKVQKDRIFVGIFFFATL